MQPNVPRLNVGVRAPDLLPKRGTKPVEDLGGGVVQDLIQQHEVVAAEALEDLAQIVVHVPLRRQPRPQLPTHIDEDYAVVCRAQHIGEHRVAVDVPGVLRTLLRFEVLEEGHHRLQHALRVKARLVA